jgi:tetratricopeptide (TPR) repeat protein
MERELRMNTRNRSIANHKLRHLDQAISDLNEAIRLQPDSAISHYNRSNTYYNIKRYHQAISDITEAIRLKSDFAGPITTGAILTP